MSNFSCLLESFRAVQCGGFWRLAASVSLCIAVNHRVFSGGSDGKESVYNARGLGLNPGLGRSSGKGNGNPFQYSCLENPVDGEAWKAPWGHEESDVTERLQFSY